MVGLHMLDDQIIRLAGTYNIFDIIKPFMGKPGVYRIHYRDFFIHDDIRIICHPVFHHILSFK